MTQPVFLYGTLLDPELYQIVAGAPLTGRHARLGGARAHCWVADETLPILTDAPEAQAEGLVVLPDTETRARLDFYKLGFGYDVTVRTVQTQDGDVEAAVYIPQHDWPKGAEWSLTDWQTQHGTLTRLAAHECMALMATHAPEAAARAFPQIRMRAASRLRARNTPSPEPLAPAMSDRVVTRRETKQPYVDYFAVREDWLAFPKFSGDVSEVVKRASFLGGDAVTVLPYDPTLDSVLVIRQFRHGAFARGDRNPWTLEPAAGRIDPGEDPEDTARRELIEETGVEAQALHFVGRYYPSPAAYSEYIYSYIALADLSGADGGVGGLETEAEDIMRHVVPLDDAMGMIATGAANTGPLILSLGWLALNKSRLR